MQTDLYSAKYSWMTLSAWMIEQIWQYRTNQKMGLWQLGKDSFRKGDGEGKIRYP